MAAYPTVLFAMQDRRPLRIGRTIGSIETGAACPQRAILALSVHGARVPGTATGRYRPGHRPAYAPVSATNGALTLRAGRSTARGRYARPRAPRPRAHVQPTRRSSGRTRGCDARAQVAAGLVVRKQDLVSG